MELIAVVAAVLLLGWWWQRSARRRRAERKAAEHRAAMGYNTGNFVVSDGRLVKRIRSGAATHAEQRRAMGYDVASDVSREWRALLDRSDVLILDTETTGLGNRAEVIEVAVLDTTGAVWCEALVMPEGRIPRDATAVHGLTRAALRAGGARPWPEVHAELLDVLDGAAVVLAWNAAFDRRLLAQTAARHGLNLPRMPWRDLLTDYREHHGEAPAKGRHTLSRAVEREWAHVDGPAHRAEGDCRRVLAVMRAVAGEARR